MKDPRSVLDSVRSKISPTAKVLIAWTEEGINGVVHCAQANLDQSELSMVIESLRANAIATRIAGNGKVPVPNK